MADERPPWSCKSHLLLIAFPGGRGPRHFGSRRVLLTHQFAIIVRPVAAAVGFRLWYRIRCTKHILESRCRFAFVQCSGSRLSYAKWVGVHIVRLDLTDAWFVGRSWYSYCEWEGGWHSIQVEAACARKRRSLLSDSSRDDVDRRKRLLRKHRFRVTTLDFLMNERSAFRY